MKGRKTWWAKAVMKSISFLHAVKSKLSESEKKKKKISLCLFSCHSAFLWQINWSPDDSWLSQTSGGVCDGCWAQPVWGTGFRAWGRSPWSRLCWCQIKTGQTSPWAGVPALDLGLTPESPTVRSVPHSCLWGWVSICLAGHVLYTFALGMEEKGSSLPLA